METQTPYSVSEPRPISRTPTGDPVQIPEEEYRRIEDLIASDQSPVGIDAKKTHVMILHQLAEIVKRLDRLEAASGDGIKR